MASPSKDSCKGLGWKAKLDHCLHDKNCRFTTFLDTLEQNTGIERTKLVIGVCSILALYLTIGYGKDFLCNFIGFVYPAYCSIKAIESMEKDDDTKWLTYWVVYSLFAVVESFTDFFLSWIPLYFLLKCVFLLYCMAPGACNGSLTIYQKVIRPFFLKHEKNVDSGVKYATDIGRDFIAEAREASEKVIRDVAEERFTQVTSLKEEKDDAGHEEFKKDN